MAEVDTPKTIAKGNLSRTPFAHLLIYVDQNKLSGTLAIWPETPGEAGEEQDRILFQRGRLVAARLMQPAGSLEQGLMPLFIREQAPYAFYAEDLVGRGEGRLDGRIDPLALICKSLRTFARDDVVDDVLKQLGSAKLRVQPKAELHRLELEPKERALVELLQAEPADVQTLIRGSGLPERRGRRLIYLLVTTKAVVIYEEKPKAEQPAQPPSPGFAAAGAAAGDRGRVATILGFASPAAAAGKPSAISEKKPEEAKKTSSAPPDQRQRRVAAELAADMPKPPDGLSPDLLKQWKEMVSLGERIDGTNYFEMLGLKLEASSNDAKSAFLSFAKKWHPDRIPEEIKPLKPLIEMVFARVNEAHQCLSNDKRRAEYAETVKQGGGTQEAAREVQQIMDAAIEYQKVEVMVRRRDYDQALELLETILSMHNKEADYHAMYAWILLQKFPGKDAPLEDIMKAAQTAARLNPDHERANLCKALALKRMGKDKDALRVFKDVIKINPHNVEAAREVHLAEMRRQGKYRNPAVADEGPLPTFSKLFKKKSSDKPEKP